MHGALRILLLLTMLVTCTSLRAAIAQEHDGKLRIIVFGGHPDHRYTGVLVQDAAFMVTVPYFCPDTPHLKRNPVFLCSSDRFQKPYPFQADIAVSLDDVFEQKIDAVSERVSQNVEGGAGGSQQRFDQVPKDPKLQRAWLKKRWVY